MYIYDLYKLQPTINGYFNIIIIKKGILSNNSNPLEEFEKLNKERLYIEYLVHFLSYTLINIYNFEYQQVSL